MSKDSYVNYTTWKEFSHLLTTEDKAALYDAQLDYHNDGKVKDMSPVAQAVFIAMRLQYNVNNEKWEKEREKRAEAGRRSGAVRRSLSNAKLPGKFKDYDEPF